MYTSVCESGGDGVSADCGGEDVSVGVGEAGSDDDNSCIYLCDLSWTKDY